MDKVIFWDFDGTLVNPNKRFVLALNFSLKKFGYSTDLIDIENFLKTVYPWLNYDKTYENETGKWWDNFLSSLNQFYCRYNVKIAEYNKISLTFKERITTFNDYVLYDDTKCVLEGCIKRGYKNYLLSNNFPELTNFIEDFGLMKYFSGLIISSHIGYEKPRKELFDYAKKLADCDSGFMIGDNPNADIIGGKNAGLKTVFVHNQSESVADYTFNTLKPILDILE